MPKKNNEELAERQLLTGRQLRIAAEKKLKVRYVENYYSPYDEHMNFDDECVMEEAVIGYYIGNSDIEPEDFSDDEFVGGDFPEGTFGVYAVEGVKY